jgi:tRNA pseudouridine55 synthase
MARRGEEVRMPSRDIRIDELEILGYECPDLRLRVRCSKGTYIRSLARDLGKACGSRAYVQELRRTAVGPFRLEDAVDPEAFAGPEDFQSWESFFSVLEGTQIAEISETALEKMRHGVPFRPGFLKESIEGEPEMVLLKDGSGNLKAVLERKEGRYSYKINLCS